MRGRRWSARGEEGCRVFFLYKAIVAASSPFLWLHLLWRRRRGLEHNTRWRERLGYASITRPPGPLLWFHAVSVGEAMAALPIIKHCTIVRPSLNVLLTTSTVTSFFIVQQLLPHSVICQFAPIDAPHAVERFLNHWCPEAGIFMENELWPYLLLSSSRKGVTLALLNARMSNKSFERWLIPSAKPLISEMLKKFSLIAPLSTKEAVHFQVLGAPPTIIQFAGNLKYAVGSVIDPIDMDLKLSKLKAELSYRTVWIAASTHAGEEELVANVHKLLKAKFPSLLTIIAPRHQERGEGIADMLRQQGLELSRRSHGDAILPETDIYVADTIGELKILYKVSLIAFIGGSLLKSLSGHNLAEAASAGCAVLTGPYIGHFSQMVKELRQFSTLSVQQVSGKDELLQALEQLFSDPLQLEARREAARKASMSCAKDVIMKIWALLENSVLAEAFPSIKM